jgi:hypothetical protein
MDVITQWNPYAGIVTAGTEVSPEIMAYASCVLGSLGLIASLASFRLGARPFYASPPRIGDFGSFVFTTAGFTMLSGALLVIALALHSFTPITIFRWLAPPILCVALAAALVAQLSLFGGTLVGKWWSTFLFAGAGVCFILNSFATVPSYLLSVALAALLFYASTRNSALKGLFAVKPFRFVVHGIASLLVLGVPLFSFPAQAGFVWIAPMVYFSFLGLMVSFAESAGPSHNSK